MIAVVGGGIAGIACVHALMRRGAATMLVDSGDARTTGASAVPAAVLNPFRGKRAVPSAADLAGLDRFLSLVNEIDSGTRVWHPVGILRIADHAERAARWQTLSGVRWLRSEELADVARIELDAPHGGFYFERGGYVHTAALRGALLEAACQGGAHTALHTHVDRIDADQDGVSLTTSAGVMRVSQVIACTGASVVPWTGAEDLRRVDGELLEWDRTELNAPQSPSTSEPVIISRCLLIRSPQRVWVGGIHVGTRGTGPDDSAQLRSAAGALWPLLAVAPIARSFRATRAASSTNVPRVRRLNSRVWAVEALAGRGYLRAFDLAEEVVHAVLAAQ